MLLVILTRRLVWLIDLIEIPFDYYKYGIAQRNIISRNGLTYILLYRNHAPTIPMKVTVRNYAALRMKWLVLIAFNFVLNQPALITQNKISFEYSTSKFKRNLFISWKKNNIIVKYINRGSGTFTHNLFA